MLQLSRGAGLVRLRVHTVCRSRCAACRVAQRRTLVPPRTRTTTIPLRVTTCLAASASAGAQQVHGPIAVWHGRTSHGATGAGVVAQNRHGHTHEAEM
jgi:hypothetical protein